MEGTPTPKHLGALRRGVELEDGPARAASVRIVDARGERGQLALVMTEGRKREVRRLLAAVDLPVARLVRVRIGPISLGRLKAGAVRDLTADEVLSLAKLVAKAKRRVRRDEASSL